MSNTYSSNNSVPPFQWIPPVGQLTNLPESNPQDDWNTDDWNTSNNPSLSSDGNVNVDDSNSFHACYFDGSIPTWGQMPSAQPGTTNSSSGHTLPVEAGNVRPHTEPWEQVLIDNGACVPNPISPHPFHSRTSIPSRFQVMMPTDDPGASSRGPSAYPLPYYNLDPLAGWSEIGLPGVPNEHQPGVTELHSYGPFTQPNNHSHYLTDHSHNQTAHSHNQTAHSYDQTDHSQYQTGHSRLMILANPSRTLIAKSTMVFFHRPWMDDAIEALSPHLGRDTFELQQYTVQQIFRSETKSYLTCRNQKIQPLDFSWVYIVTGLTGSRIGNNRSRSIKSQSTMLNTLRGYRDILEQDTLSIPEDEDHISFDFGSVEARTSSSNPTRLSRTLMFVRTASIST